MYPEIDNKQNKGQVLQPTSTPFFFFFPCKTKWCTSEIKLQLGYKHQEDDCTLEFLYERRKKKTHENTLVKYR